MTATLPRRLTRRALPSAVAVLAIVFGVLSGSWVCLLPGAGLLALQSALLVADDDGDD